MDAVARTVLVVDDNAENRALAAATLEDEGITAVLASDGLEGIAAFEREQPDCILLDIRMPGMDGITVCEKIRALPKGADTAIVFVTAQRDVETFDRAVAAGGDDFITKPFRPAEMIVRLHTALRLRRLAIERSELYAQIKGQRDDLQRLQLYKEQFVGFLVHDFKNPVNAIALHAQRVLRSADATPKAKDAAEKIQDETRALMRMITNLLDISKADEGRLTPTLQDVDAHALVSGVLEEMHVRAAASKVKLVAAVDVDVLHVDRDLVHRVLVNLVENAIRHAPEESSIEVSARRNAAGSVLRVKDAGPGIAADKRSEVFERFVSAGSGSNRGLGLAFCKLAVEAHGGSISIEDAAPGAVFCVEIPDVH